MKAVYITISAIVVGIIAYLIACKVAAAQKKTTVQDPKTPPPPPPVTVTTTSATATPVAITNRVTINSSDGKAYNLTLPAPYNTMPVADALVGGTARADETLYYMYKYKSTPMIWVVKLTGMTDAAVLDYLNSIKPASTDHQFVINQSSKIIKGSF